jgi:hypothetical protein
LDDNNFLKFLEEQKIKIVDGFSENKKKIITAEDVRKQISAVNEFHENTMSHGSILFREVKNKTGKTLESYKLSIRKLKKEMLRMKEEGIRNEAEKLIFQAGEEYICRAENSFKEIFEADYAGIIRRSMDRTEICLGNVRFDNMRKNDFLEIVDLKKCCYDVVEMDAVALFSCTRRKKPDFDWKQLAGEYCCREKLSKNSEKFILAVLSYPSEFMKYFNRYYAYAYVYIYICGNKYAGITLEYEKKIKKVMIRDSSSFK